MNDAARGTDWTAVVAMVVGAAFGGLFGSLVGDGWGARILWASVGLACGLAIREERRRRKATDD
jgi:uncharacterized protein YcfJ